MCFAWGAIVHLAIVLVVIWALVIIAVILVVGELLACLWTYVWPAALR